MKINFSILVNYFTIFFTFFFCKSQNKQDFLPLNYKKPSIISNSNHEIKVINGLWEKETITYQWILNGIRIPGETSQILNIDKLPLGQTVQCEVSSTNSFGSSTVITKSFSTDNGYNKALTPRPGYILVEELSDEFNGVELDTNKWYNYMTYWNGRGSTFTRSNVSVNNGSLKLKSSVIDKDQLNLLYNIINHKLTNIDTIVDLEKWNCSFYGLNWKPSLLLPINDSLQKIGEKAIGSAAVMSKTRIAEKGYYEARIKTSKISMSSSFWLHGGGSEIDVIESYGAVSVLNLSHVTYKINSNFHSGGNSLGGIQYVNKNKTSDYYFVLGMLWEDTTVKVYINDEQVMSKDLRSNPKVDFEIFSSLKHLIFDTEILSAPWNGWPSFNDLTDDKLNIFYIDWVRVWRRI
jgi:hypothetical protein